MQRRYRTLCRRSLSAVVGHVNFLAQRHSVLNDLAGLAIPP
jgi:hypothetical protein